MPLFGIITAAGSVVGAGLGIAKAVNDQAQANTTNLQRDVEQKYQSLTHMTPRSPAAPVNTFGDILGGTAGGAMLGQGIGGAFKGQMDPALAAVNGGFENANTVVDAPAPNMASQYAMQPPYSMYPMAMNFMSGKQSPSGWLGFNA